MNIYSKIQFLTETLASTHEACVDANGITGIAPLSSEAGVALLNARTAIADAIDALERHPLNTGLPFIH
ncbi:MAG TPA: hypothetical protein DEP05_09195 [Betaproteobacteria bacterium]|nr:hypothetical protein [Betaproteobacteria bacterium]